VTKAQLVTKFKDGCRGGGVNHSQESIRLRESSQMRERANELVSSCAPSSARTLLIMKKNDLSLHGHQQPTD